MSDTVTADEIKPEREKSPPVFFDCLRDHGERKRHRLSMIACGSGAAVVPSALFAVEDHRHSVGSMASRRSRMQPTTSTASSG